MRPFSRHPFSFLSRVGLILVLLSWSSPLHAKETDEDMPVVAVGGAVHADLFTGTATTSIPIEVPPGRNGMQPNLQLVYESANGNGWVGMGWKLELGTIERQTRFGVNYSTNDYTMRLNGVSSDLVGIGSDEYRAKGEGAFLRIKKLPEGGWEVTDKKGTKYFFGQTAASRMADPADATRIFKWCLDRVEDTSGNYMEAIYWGYQGQGYLDEVHYTGWSTTIQPTNTIKFYRETRPDAPDMYPANFLIKTVYRLKTIDVLANGNRVRVYKLGYMN